MPSAGTAHVAITPGGVIAGDPAVLAELCARRGPAVLAFVEEVCDPSFHVRAAADAFARFRAEVADGPLELHPDTLLMRATRRAALELSPPGPDLGCAPARPLLSGRAERSIEPADEARLSNHLRICGFCRDLAQRIAAAETAYREADEAPVPSDAAAAIVAAMAAAAPLRSTPEEPRFNGRPPARPPEVEPRVEKPEPRVDEDPAEETAEPELVVAGPQRQVAEPDPEPEPEAVTVPDAPRSLKPYYELPPPPTRRRRREWDVSARVGAVAGAAAALTRRARGTAERVLDRPSPAWPEPASETPPPLPEVEPEPSAPSEETAFVEASPPEPAPEIAIVAEPEPEPQPEPEPEPAPEPIAPGRKRERSAPPRLARPARERRHRPLREHSPSELVMPTALVVAAVAVILAIAGVFGGESSSGPTVSQVRVSQPSPARLASVPAGASATSVSLERAASVTGAPTATTSATPPVLTTSP